MKPVEAMVLLMCAVVGVVLFGRRLKMPERSPGAFHRVN
jgi:hypothetical protein